MKSIRTYLEATDSVVVFDPAITTRNCGDQVISDAVFRELIRLFPDLFHVSVPTHERIGLRSYRFCAGARVRLVGGSNILAPNFGFDSQWRIRPWDLAFVKDLVLLGVGWRNYKQRSHSLSDLLLRRALHRTAVHSARDGFTRSMLEQRGVGNVVNTSCVTMWDLDVEGLSRLPARKAGTVVTTVNADHHRHPFDRQLLGVLCDLYESVYLWPQGIADQTYISELLQAFPRASALGANLASYDQLLSHAEDLEFVGNRLHGGVRALQHGHRAMIVSIDNRASEIARDTNLPVLDLSAGESVLRQRLTRPEPIEIRLPTEAIATWRAQFET